MGNNLSVNEREEETTGHYTRKGRRADEDIEQGVDEFFALQDNPEALRLHVRGKVQKSYGC